MLHLGIDPGGSGAIAVIYNGELPYIFRLNKLTPHEISERLEKLSKEKCHCILENVSSMPGQGVASTFKFGWNAGMIEGLLIANRIPYEKKTPQTWMKYFGMKKEKTESGTQWKNRLKAKAQQLYPNITITNDMADAILIAYFCWKTYNK